MTSGSEPLAGEPRSGNPPAVLVALYWRRLPVRRGYRSSDRLAAAARRFQSGVVNDYVT